MFLKNNKIAFVLSIVATALIFCSLLVNHQARVIRNFQYSLENEYFYEPTTFEDVTEAVAIETTAPGNEIIESTTDMIESTVQQTISPDIQSEYDRLQKSFDNKIILSRSLMLVNIILVAVIVFLLRKVPVISSVETAFIGLFLGVGYHYVVDVFNDFASMGISVVLILISIYCLHDIIYWIMHKFYLDVCLPYRIGNIVVSKTNKSYIQIVISGIWLALCVSTSVILMLLFWPFNLVNIENVISILALLFAIISIACFVKTVSSVKHAEEQVIRLYNGETLEVTDGTYKSMEDKLFNLKEERDKAISEALVSERFKVDLITNVSHDLRTPLTSILGYGELLNSETLSDEGKYQLDQLNMKALYMKNLVDELFELTKVSSGVIEPNIKEIDLVKLMEQTIGLFEDRIKAGHLNVKTHYQESKILINTDGAMLHQVLSNILGNAIKYSPIDSRIHIRIFDEGEKHIVRMTNVSSYEMDFEPEEILQRFVRGDKARSTSGSGLGLAIAKTYTEALGGNFHIEIDGEQFIAIVEIN